MKLGKLQEQISKTSLPVSADLSNDFTSIILETDQTKITLHEVNFGGVAKYLQCFINNATYHPMNHDADVTYQTVNLFSSDKCLSTSSLIFHIKFGQISTAMSVQFW